jgi:prepilin-type N-terminal cleavage/methylation domain-containing protein
MKRRRHRNPRQEGGFTLIEILVALFVLVVGLAGILAMSLSGSRAAGYARHATEASVVGEDKIETLRMTPAAVMASGTDLVDARAAVTVDGLFRRDWQVSWDGTLATIVVSVHWVDDGFDHAITYRTMRSR